ncbi:aquaporin-3-like isoform X3 [Mauremys mutica]|uniref:aquaporin-3-like isoform X3 n=1 Tax=Mauremys mutica TaxID=74926 RepID=UPI001D16CABF|nr:aquaporin-3-like isoform X3 [Mauremys mutica]
MVFRDNICCEPNPESKMLEKIKKALTIRNRTVREALAEALGTFLLMFFGIGGVAQVILGKGEFGKYLSINLAFGIGVTMGIHAAGGISDALCEYSDGHYIVTGPNGTAGIFATYPAPYMTLLGGFVNEFLATTVLMLGILAIYDKKNNGALEGTQPVITGLLVLVIGMTMGINTGYAINPSRDLPPRIFTAIAGWGIEVFRAGDYWWWVPIVAPTLGSLAGALAYKLLIDFHNQSALEGGDEKRKDDLQTNHV